MRKIRVGYDARDLFFAQTGTRTFSEELLREIRKDNDVELITLAPVYAKPPIGKLSKALAHLRFIFWKVVTLPRLAKRADVDFLICPDYVAPFLFLGKIKTLPVFHGCNIWELPENYNSIWRLYFSFLAKLGEQRAHAVLTVSEFSKDRLRQVLGLNPEKIRVIPIGAKRFEGVGMTATHPRPFEADYLLHIGVLDKRKNLPALVEAFSNLEDKRLHLILVGGRPSKVFMDGYPEIVDKINERGLQSRVHLEGYVADELLPAYYRHACAYVFPSSYEGFGIPVLEAYQYGLPLAASSAASLPEVVGAGGLLFDPRDVGDMTQVITRLLRMDAVERAALRAGQKDVLERFNWPNAWKVIKEVMHG
ncbi:MAG: glycosyltransferase family 4 protein [Lunatimonas sp.]|uniref:glycosyltransferase family 4 protein n=1 Tax=Lunatimonas sp. TaxID=2060141 RepID=UPI00263B4F6F|nr:glycosyltransferase family 1 protein [Lunatimonas sp.]MCC5938448.1 glycosyltransferase family 4 protein [Lunatimonas sp.]